jgi:hypothetical protein
MAPRRSLQQVFHGDALLRRFGDPLGISTAMALKLVDSLLEVLKTRVAPSWLSMAAGSRQLLR